MPQLIALAVMSAGVYAGYRWVSKQVRLMTEEAERRAQEAAARAEPQDLGELEWDGDAGVYRPRNRTGA